jgi:hypothetical protein
MELLGYVQLVINNKMKKYIYLFCLCVQIVSCQNRTIKPTPKEFVSKVKVPENIYSKDSIKLVELVKEEIKEHKGAYYAKFYDKHTEIIIDSIIYSPNHNKLFFFIINRVENKKVYPSNLTAQEIETIVKETKLPYEGYHYEGKAYIGVRKDNNLVINNFFRINTANYSSLKEVRARLNQLFFEEYSAVKENGYEYNPDDIRFWENKSIWDISQKD